MERGDKKDESNMKHINLRKELQEAENRIIQAGLIDQVLDWLNEEQERDIEIRKAIHSGNEHNILLSPYFVHDDATFSLAAIRKVAIKYRLRFLNSQLFKGEIPNEAIAKVKRLEDRSLTRLNRFYILAPAKQFQLGDCNDDPLLFVPLSNGKFYLVHQWGNDLKWYRKWAKFPLRNWFTLTLTLLVMNLSLTMLMPTSAFAMGEESAFLNSGRIIFFFWINLLVAAIFSYAGFAFNFTFSKHNWNSKFFND